MDAQSKNADLPNLKIPPHSEFSVQGRNPVVVMDSEAFEMQKKLTFIYGLVAGGASFFVISVIIIFLIMQMAPPA